MAVPIKKLSVSLIKRNAIKRGPTSSDAWNDSFEETVNDLSRFVSQWNDSLNPLLDFLPDGTNDLDAYTDGLDGRTLYVDYSATSTVSDTTYFNLIDNRPNSVKEQFSNVYTTITQLQADLEAQISSGSGALTDAQKDRIGANIFDNFATSSITSLDGKSENSRLNLIQVARDLYGPGFTLDNDGAANLTNSVMAMVDALLELHNGNWDNDITLSHAGAIDTSNFMLLDGTQSMTGNLKLANGTAGSPSLTFDSDQDTGLFRPAANQLGFSAGGTELGKFDAVTGALLVDKIQPNFLTSVEVTAPTGGLVVVSSTSLKAQGPLETTHRVTHNTITVTAAGPYAVLSTDHYVIINQTIAAPIQVDLPLTPELGRVVKLKDGKGDANTNNITVDGNGNNIDGVATFVVNADYQSMEFVWNGSEWSAF